MAPKAGFVGATGSPPNVRSSAIPLPSSVKSIRTVCAFLLAVPLIGSGINAAIPFVEPPTGTGFRGEEILQSLRDGGLFQWLALAHAIVGIGLLVPRTRFVVALLQLPASIGIFAFNAVLFPPGLMPAIGILALNLVVLYQPRRIALLFDESAASPTPIQPLAVR